MIPVLRAPRHPTPPSLDGVLAAARDFTSIHAQVKASISERAQVFATTGYWVPRARRG